MFDRLGPPLNLNPLSIYSNDGRSKITLDEVLDVLAFCDKWEVPSAQGYCLEYLYQAIKRRELHPMLAFTIGRKFSQSHWLRDALNTLQQIPIGTWVEDPRILKWTSPHDALVVFRLREYTHALRLEFACFRPPVVHAPECTNQHECSFLWEASWALTIVPRITHSSYSPGELLMSVRDLHVDGMGKGCVEASRDEALRSDRFYMHTRGVDKALQLIN